MNREEILRMLSSHKQELIEHFGVKRLSLFGSLARDEARDDSDMDILVEFSDTPTARDYFGLLFWLEDHVPRKIDLVTDRALRPELRPYVEKDKIDVA